MTKFMQVSWIGMIAVMLTVFLSGCDAATSVAIDDEPVPDTRYVAPIKWRYAFELSDQANLVSMPNNELIQFGYGWMLRSSDKGKSWSRTDFPVPDGWRYIGRSTMSADGTIVAIVGQTTDDEARQPYYGAAASYDRGVTFEDITPPEWLGVQNPTALAFGITRGPGGRVLLDLSKYFLTFDPETNHWERLPIGRPSTPSNMAISNDGQNAIIGTRGIIYRSTNGGLQWQSRASDKFVRVYNVRLATNGEMYAVADVQVGINSDYRKSLFRSENGGGTWTRIEGISLEDEIGSVLVAADDALIAQITSNGQTGIFRSVDGGETWGRVQSGLPTFVSGNLSIPVGKPQFTSDGYVYFVSGTSVYMTTNSLGYGVNYSN